MFGKILRSPAATVALFAVAAVLLATGSIGAVQAAPRVVSADYRAEVELASIETTLVENGVPVQDGGELLASLAADDGGFKVGKAYPEALAVQNSGTIDEYVRVTVTKYWTNGTGKDVSLDPALIQLRFLEGNGWTIDAAASTAERTVLYYSSPIVPGEATAPFTDTISIDGNVVTSVTKLADGDYEFDYEGLQFRVKAVADAVQTHNGEAAMTGAWGRTV